MSKKNVLIIEDQHWVKIMLKEVLSTSGFDTSVASNCFEAVEKVKIEQPEIVILDVNLPDIDGFELLSKLRKIKSDIKPIFISGSSNAKFAQRAITEGALRYFIKPFDVFDLVTCLNEISSLDVASRGEV